jgi:hypothetical protein
MFCPIPKVLNNKSVIAIPSSCIYKHFQSSNYEIKDCFYDEGIAQNHVFMLLMELPQTFGLQLQDPHVLAIHPINFLFKCKMHIHYI